MVLKKSVIDQMLSTDLGMYLDFQVGDRGQPIGCPGIKVRVQHFSTMALQNLHSKYINKTKGITWKNSYIRKKSISSLPFT